MSALPIPRPAQYPAVYEAARTALARCEAVDECKDWADKAAALAVYGRQSKDDTLIIMAQRIQARAIRRCGELLREIPLGNEPTRTAIARTAGMSRVEQRQAVQIAQIPGRQFERIVESESLPKPYKLAQIGVRKRPTQEKAAEPIAVKCCPSCGRPL